MKRTLYLCFLYIWARNAVCWSWIKVIIVVCWEFWNRKHNEKWIIEFSCVLVFVTRRRVFWLLLRYQEKYLQGSKKKQLQFFFFFQVNFLRTKLKVKLHAIILLQLLINIKFIWASQRQEFKSFAVKYDFWRFLTKPHEANCAIEDVDSVLKKVLIVLSCRWFVADPLNTSFWNLYWDAR